ncbi:MAG: Uncharacterised protein [Formosa sp. Hel3_A1_48]|nr:MAG: Uncharacterised protein [Formosa sp. Hel3_A1_48]
MPIFCFCLFFFYIDKISLIVFYSVSACIDNKLFCNVFRKFIGNLISTNKNNIGRTIFIDTHCIEYVLLLFHALILYNIRFQRRCCKSEQRSNNNYHSNGKKDRIFITICIITHNYAVLTLTRFKRFLTFPWTT